MKGCPFAAVLMIDGAGKPAANNGAAAGRPPKAERDVNRQNAAPRGVGSQASQNDAEQEERADKDGDGSYYEQLGGDNKMAMFVEDFMEGIMADAELACHHKQFQDPDAMEMLKTKLCAFFKWKLDGARFYIGRPMPEVHKNLGISDDIFDKACQVFITSLKKFNPSQDVFDTFVGRISGLRHEICFPPVNE